MIRFSCLALAILLCLTPILHALKEAEEYGLRQKIRKMINKDGGSGRNGGPQPDLRLVAGLVRLAFHDCVGKKCDGCINIKNSENAGLDIYINEAEKLYTTLKDNGKPILSRADFWALSAIEAIQFATELATCRRCPKEFPIIKFKTGRKDCVGSPKGSPWTKDVHKFPDPLGTTEGTTSFFKKQFGFGAMETVAILGAHTLGQAHRFASGFSNPWVERRNRFNNDYFKALIDKDKKWKIARIGPPRNPKWQWESELNGRKTMMLNCDMAMVKNLTDVSTSGEVRGCTYSTCKTVNADVAKTAYWVKKFAKDNSLFLEKFGKAFQKMINHGYEHSQLKEVEKSIAVG